MTAAIIAWARPLDPHLRDTARVLHRAGALARRGGVLLMAPGDPPPLPLGVHFVPLPVPPGADSERAHAIAADALGARLDQRPVALVHVFDVRLALPALVRRRRGVRVVVEPGVTPSHRLRVEQPELVAERMVDLVALEDNVLTRADAVVARSTVEAASLARRGVPDESVWTLYDGLLDRVAEPTHPSMPLLLTPHTGEPWEDWPGVLDACVRVEAPWRLTVMGPQSTSTVEARARAQRVENRVDSAPADEPHAPRVAAALAIVCNLRDVRPVVCGSVVPEATLLALSAGRPLVAPDLAAIRAYAGGAALYYPPGDTGALAARLAQILHDADLRAELIARALVQRERYDWARAEELLDDLWTSLDLGGV